MAGLLTAIEVSSKGLSVQRSKMNVVAENIANAETTETKDGTPYKRKMLDVSEDTEKINFSSQLKKAGVRLQRTSSGHMPGKLRSVKGSTELSNVDSAVVEDKSGNFKLVHDPSHPDADAEGYVKYPDVEIVTEMVDMMAASRAYEANTVAISTAKSMAEKALDI